ncbi:MAG TPA: NAD(P)-dependent oxidoreductase [Tepidisphaeraceae bacterium]|jgi:nucleoside-diphosphate-sugar epimerase|nr:NAD(P)-dependent oxidoreductase [Tepidisphaeraceae bacterium]
MKKTVVITGGSGKLGRACVAHFLEHGYRVVNADLVPPVKPQGLFVKVDLTDFGQAIDALSGIDNRLQAPVDAVVHLAAIPAPGMETNAVTFRQNIVSTYNVFEAARRQGVKNVVWASSETVLGLPFDVPPPYVPVDEAYPGRPETAYSLSKYLGEQMAEQFCRWDPAMKMIGLRFSNVMEPEAYQNFPSFERNPNGRKWNLWGYIDARDASQAIRKAVEAPLTGADVFIIANADTVMTRPNSDLLTEMFPNVPVKGQVGANETLLSIEKARRVLGYEPQYNWRSEKV